MLIALCLVHAHYLDLSLLPLLLLLVDGLLHGLQMFGEFGTLDLNLLTAALCLSNALLVAAPLAG
ncbi:hypothetical protein D3C80_1644190 [compost metagenome]